MISNSCHPPTDGFGSLLPIHKPLETSSWRVLLEVDMPVSQKKKSGFSGPQLAGSIFPRPVFGSFFPNHFFLLPNRFFWGTRYFRPIAIWIFWYPLPRYTDRGTKAFDPVQLGFHLSLSTLRGDCSGWMKKIDGVAGIGGSSVFFLTKTFFFSKTYFL